MISNRQAFDVLDFHVFANIIDKRQIAIKEAILTLELRRGIAGLKLDRIDNCLKRIRIFIR